MADVRRVKMEGVTELKKALAGLGEIVATKVGAKANRDAAVEFRDLLVDVAPYDPRDKTKSWRRKDGSVGTANYGHLRDNITVRKAKARTEHTITYRVTVGKAFWASFLEFGTAKMAAHPWMRPAFDVAADRLLKVQIQGLHDGIEREAKKAARASGVKPRGRNGR